MFAANKTRHRLSGLPGGFTLFETGTSSFVVPAGVTSISAVAIGGGGGGQNADTSNVVKPGGGGGALAWSPSIAVTPGETLTLVVGNRGNKGNPATSGTASSISRGATTLLSAAGGGGGSAFSPGIGGAIAASIGQFKFAGGDGSFFGTIPANQRGGGGGAAGYFGNGGGSNNGGNGSGGAAGMGGNLTLDNQFGDSVTGGGTFPFGYSGLSGNKGANNGKGYLGSSSTSTTEAFGYYDNLFGGGGGGGVGVGATGGTGGFGGMRILWNIENVGDSFIPPAMPTVFNSQFFQRSAASPGTVTIPANIQVGDVILLYLNYVRTDSLTPTPSGTIPPTNFKEIIASNLGTSGTYTGRYYLNKRLILDSSVAGTTVTIPAGTGGTVTIAMIVLRASPGLNVFGTSDSPISQEGLQTTNIAITNTQTFNATNQTRKGIVVTFAFLHNFDSWPQTVTWTGASQLTTGLATLECYYKIYPFSATSTNDSVSASSNPGVKAGLVFPLVGY